jgi:hypothetical protein
VRMWKRGERTNRDEDRIGGFTWQGGFDGQADGHHRHQGFIRHGINHGPNYGLQLICAGDPAIDEVSDACVDEQGQRGEMLVMEEEIADDGRADEAGEGEEVGKVVDVFVGIERGQKATW